MRVSEIYASIEGETSFVGLPTIFVRFSKCNLDCYYCDSRFTREIYEEVPVEEVLQRIFELRLKRVCVTGGEPLLEKELPQLLDRLIKKGYEVILETNGSLSLKGIDKRVIKIVDVKTPSSNNGKETFFMKNLEYLTGQDELKFVLSDRNDYEYAVNFLKKHDLLRKGVTILFSAVFERLDYKDLISWVIDDGYDFIRINFQVHKFIWGKDTKGV